MKAQIRGGRNDGRVVEYIGPALRLPTPARQRGLTASEADIGKPPDIRIEEFEATRGLDGEHYYVLTGTARY